MAESIAQWLDKLGLGQYTQAFADNGVELDHLTHLTDDDLKERAAVGTASPPAGCRPDLSAELVTHPAKHPISACRRGATRRS